MMFIIKQSSQKENQSWRSVQKNIC